MTLLDLSKEFGVSYYIVKRIAREVSPHKRARYTPVSRPILEKVRASLEAGTYMENRSRAHKTPITTNIPVVRKIFEIAEKRGVLDKEFGAQVGRYRSGQATPDIWTIMDMADVLGYDVILMERHEK